MTNLFRADRSPRSAGRRVASIVFSVVLLIAASARATGGPENVLLVVNARSADSLCIANYYAALRHIPASNFLFLDWDPQQETTDVNTFRERILTPVVRTARLPVPGRQIDFVVYSSGFPWGIRIEGDVQKFSDLLEKQEKDAATKPDSNRASWVKALTPVASLNGLTYLCEPVLGGAATNGITYLDPFSNWYARTGSVEEKEVPSLSFSAAAAYGPRGEVAATGGRRYLLSMLLGVTAGRGNTLDEVLSYLRRSAAADGTRPRGTIYFVQNGDVRSKVRQGGFPNAVRQIKALGVAAEILEGTLPKNKPDVQGAMLGLANFDWKACGSTILPGAICEHFTSYGGEMSRGAQQTPLTEFLRYGAAAASGTVTEPYAISYKFPTAAMQVHYVRGCTAVEAFYRSVLCPYQLLIVGDPLCRPWANTPVFTVAGLTAGETVRGELKVAPEARFARDLQAEHFELVLDGMKIRECPSGGTLEFNTAALADGAHELRVVAASKGPVVARGEKIFAITTANHNRQIEVACEPAKTVSVNESLLIKVKSSRSVAIQIARGTRLLGKIDGDSGQVKIPAAALGRGPVQLQVIGLGNVGPTSHVVAQPLEIEVK